MQIWSHREKLWFFLPHSNKQTARHLDLLFVFSQVKLTIQLAVAYHITNFDLNVQLAVLLCSSLNGCCP